MSKEELPEELQPFENIKQLHIEILPRDIKYGIRCNALYCPISLAVSRALRERTIRMPSNKIKTINRLVHVTFLHKTYLLKHFVLSARLLEFRKAVDSCTSREDLIPLYANKQYRLSAIQIKPSRVEQFI